MPGFYVDEIEISPDEFVTACSKRELGELVDALKDEGYVILEKNNKDSNVNEFTSSLDILKESKHMLSLEEEQMLIKMAERFRHIVLK